MNEQIKTIVGKFSQDQLAWENDSCWIDVNITKFITSQLFTSDEKLEIQKNL